MVAGDGLVGVIVAFLVGSWGAYRTFYNEHTDMLVSLSGAWGPWLALALFLVMAYILAQVTLRAVRK